MQKLLGFVLVAGVAGCAPYAGFYREGQTVSRLNADLTACEVGGVQQVPVSTQVRTTPIEVIPGPTTCKPDGTCTTGPSRVEGGDIYTVDANEGLRTRFVAQCMADRGYQEVQIPQCSAAVSKIAAARAPQVLPPLSPSLCAARSGDGYVFVTTAPAG